MTSQFTPWEEVHRYRHSVLPDSEQYKLIRVQYDFDYEERKHTIVLTLKKGESRRILRFNGAMCSHALDHVFGLYILDLTHRGWEQRVEVGEFYEEGGVYFYADSVEDISHGV